VSFSKERKNKEEKKGNIIGIQKEKRNEE